MKRVISSTVFIFFVACFIFAQQKNATISYESLSHDFGKIKEEDGSVMHEFVFTNTGSVPLVIKRVTASCGCTTPDWTKAPVVPGDKGYVKATYNPRNRPGKFNKTISVSSNANKPVTILRILGDVIEKEKTIEDIYRYPIGGLRMMSNHIAFGKILKGQVKTKVVEIINTHDQPLKISFNNVPAHIKINSAPETLKPNEKGIIEATYDADKKNDWGFITNRLKVLLNGANLNNNSLIVSATIEEDFSMLTEEELAKAPKIKFVSRTFNFGTMKQKESVEHNFVFTNTGKKDLIIRKIKSTCGCTVVSPKDKVISSGESSSIKAKFNAGIRKGRQNKAITVITNDPNNSTIYLKITGIVEEVKK